MNFINRIEIQGRVGSHKIELGKSGSWGGWFDLHSEGFDGRIWAPALEGSS